MQAADVCILFLGSRMHKYLNHDVNDRPWVRACCTVHLLHAFGGARARASTGKLRRLEGVGFSSDPAERCHA